MGLWTLPPPEVQPRTLAELSAALRCFLQVPQGVVKRRSGVVSRQLLWGSYSMQLMGFLVSGCCAPAYSVACHRPGGCWLKVGYHTVDLTFLTCSSLQESFSVTDSQQPLMLTHYIVIHWSQCAAVCIAPKSLLALSSHFTSRVITSLHTRWWHRSTTTSRGCSSTATRMSSCPLLAMRHSP